MTQEPLKEQEKSSTDTVPDTEAKSPENQEKLPTDVAFGIGAIFQLIKLYQRASHDLLGVVIIFGIVAVVSLISIPAFLISNNQNYALVSFIIFFIFAILTTFVFLRLSKLSAAQEIKIKVIVPIWQRRILKYPPRPRRKLEELARLLNKSHAEISRFISDKIDSNVERTNLRTKIFLPKFEHDDDGNGAGKGYVCTLVMHRDLQINMTAATDKDLALRPGEGLSGRVFVLGSPDGRYNLQDVELMMFPDNVGKADRNIKWIISVPLTLFDPDIEQPKPVGVLSLDCLYNSITDDEGKEIEKFLGGIAKELETVISKCQVIQLCVGTQEI